jgi:hypothetical protein
MASRAIDKGISPRNNRSGGFGLCPGLWADYNGIDHIQPSEQPVYDSPQNGLVPAPGNDDSYDSAQADTRSYINRLIIGRAIGSGYAGTQKQDGDQQEQERSGTHTKGFKDESVK